MTTNNYTASSALPAARSTFGRAVDRWISRRLLPVDRITVGRKTIFIFVSREGWMYLLLLLALFIAGINYANNLVLGLCFLLGALLLVVVHQTHMQLSGLVVEAVGAPDQQAGESVRYRVRVSATGTKPRHQIELSMDNELHVLKAVLAPREVSFYVQSHERGALLPPRLKVRSTYPLGIIEAWSYVCLGVPAWLWPIPSVIAKVKGQSTGQMTDEGQQIQRGMDEFYALEAYEPGESQSRISWRHLASGQGLLTKQYVDSIGRDWLLEWSAMRGPSDEQRLSQLLGWAELLDRQGQAFAMQLPNELIAKGQGAQQLAIVRAALARYPAAQASPQAVPTDQRLRHD